ncbi:MAG: hypothetical protein KC656_31920, partial [Myxococcales bacterium]|nr:hypothetical protein [Myxococcales bacterium]
MDLIANLSQSLGLDPTAATALAGAMMGNVAAQAEDSDVEGAGAQVKAAVPEMDGWLATAQQYVGQEEPAAQGGGMLGGLMGAASSGLGSQLVGAVGGK